MHEQTDSNRELINETRKNIVAIKEARESKSDRRRLNKYYLAPYYKKKSKPEDRKYRKFIQYNNKKNHSSWINPPIRHDIFNPPTRN